MPEKVWRILDLVKAGGEPLSGPIHSMVIFMVILDTFHWKLICYMCSFSFIMQDMTSVYSSLYF